MSRPRDLWLGLGILAILVAVVALAGRSTNRGADFDWRRSTYLAGPMGARGFAEALARLGVDVQRLRRRLADVDSLGPDARATVFAVLGPARPLRTSDAVAMIAHAREGTSLLVAGVGATALMRCFGYEVMPQWRTVEAVTSGARPRQAVPVHAVLVPVEAADSGAPAIVSSLGAADEVDWDLPAALEAVPCEPPGTTRVDTLLVARGATVEGNGPGGERRAAAAPVVIRLGLAGGGEVTLVADDGLFSNRALRETNAGPFALRLVAGRYRRLVVDEYHQGFGSSGSVLAELRSWSTRSPVGWAIWQLAAVGLVALLASGVRFGPARQVRERRRRSPLEHVHALATALAAAQGHALAAALLVQGLRRRLARGTPAAAAQPLRGDPLVWVAALASRMHTPGGRAAAEELATRLERPLRRDDVRHVAHLVEEVWTDLAPPSPTT